MMNTLNIQARQAGAALIVGLILLIVVTLVAISGIKSTSIQQSLAAGMQQNMLTFQTADTILQQVANTANSTDPLVDTDGDGVPDQQNLLVEAINNNDVTATPAQSPQVINLVGPQGGLTGTANLSYQGAVMATEGSSIGVYVNHIFQIDSRSQLATANSQANTVLGLKRLGPGS